MSASLGSAARPDSSLATYLACISHSGKGTTFQGRPRKDRRGPQEGTNRWQYRGATCLSSVDTRWVVSRKGNSYLAGGGAHVRGEGTNLAEGCRFLFPCTHVTAARLEHTLCTWGEHWSGTWGGLMPRGTQHVPQALTCNQQGMGNMHRQHLTHGGIPPDIPICTHL
jgi:hypothetical protein